MVIAGGTLIGFAHKEGLSKLIKRQENSSQRMFPLFLPYHERRRLSAFCNFEHFEEVALNEKAKEVSFRCKSKEV